uniref:DUF1269 domain-containing protein n=1 Tax=Globodera pallida TaxID=36090 RepID=A0A183BIR3_GLOPA
MRKSSKRSLEERKAYAQMMDEITYRIGLLKEKPAGDVGVAYLLSVFCCPLYCSGAIKSFCFVPLCCSEDFGPRDVPDVDKEWGGALGWVATCCWAPTFGILAAPIFGIAAAGKACANISRRDHLEDKLAKLERLRNAEIKLNEENRN